jgi:hypothetical protein
MYRVCSPFYALNINDDILGMTTDGAAVIKKIDRLAECHQQLCFAHGIQLAVIDVLYKNKGRRCLIYTLESDSESMKEMKLIKQQQITIKLNTIIQIQM